MSSKATEVHIKTKWLLVKKIYWLQLKSTHLLQTVSYPSEQMDFPVVANRLQKQCVHMRNMWPIFHGPHSEGRTRVFSDGWWGKHFIDSRLIYRVITFTGSHRHSVQIPFFLQWKQKYELRFETNNGSQSYVWTISKKADVSHMWGHICVLCAVKYCMSKWIPKPFVEVIKSP